jgi:uncharacterized sulfatase
MPGINLLDDEALAHRKSIFGECFTHNSKDLNNPAASLRWRWMIEGDWKLIVPDPKNEATSRVELYNLAHDPLEQHNLADNERDRVQSMHEQINTWWDPST